MGVNLRGGQIGVAQHFLQTAQVCPALQQVAGKCVAEQMRVQRLGNAGLTAQRRQVFPYALAADFCAGAV